MSWIERDEKVIWHPYTQAKNGRPPLVIVKGKGALLYDESGNSYIDAVASWWTNIHGHAHPYLAERIAQQARQLEHVIFAGFTHPPAIELGERLLSLLPHNQGKVFFSDNGSTAVEIAIKMAIQYAWNEGLDRRRIIAFDQAFHGETFGAMSASGDLSLNKPYHPYLFEVTRIPAPVPGREELALAALLEVLAKGDTAAFIFEPLVMGAGGMLMYSPEILDRLIAACHQRGVLCIADEVMTGFGRTGRYFACSWLQEKPDLIALSKGLTGGALPLAVTTCTERVYQAFYSDDTFKTFFHGHSFTGNPLGCAAALASLELLMGESCQGRMESIVRQHAAFVRKWLGHPGLGDVRQTGTILAVEFKTDSNSGYFNDLRDRLYPFFLKRGVLLRPLGNVVYVLPPYCITDEQLGKVYQVLEEAIGIFAGQNT